MKRQLYKVIIELFIGVIIILLLIIGAVLSYRRIEQRHVQSEINRVIEEGGISELREVELGGLTQYIAIEGTNENNPLCLFLHGGPALALPYGISARGQNQSLLSHCTAVYWDQRESGKTYVKNNETSLNVTLDQLVSDAKELINYLLESFEKHKIYVIGFSWASVLGMKLVEEIPQQIEAYIGIGQVVNPKQSDVQLYEWLLKEYTSIGANQTVLALKQMGYPPYQKESNQELFSKAIINSGAYIKIQDGVDGLNILDWVLQAFSSPDLTLKEAYDTLFTAPHEQLERAALWQELNKVAFDETLLKLKIPVYFISGVDDYICSKDILQNWVTMLNAPKKDMLILNHSAHYISAQDEDEMNAFIKSIINETYPRQEVQEEESVNSIITNLLN